MASNSSTPLANVPDLAWSCADRRATSNLVRGRLEVVELRQQYHPEAAWRRNTFTEMSRSYLPAPGVPESAGPGELNCDRTSLPELRRGAFARVIVAWTSRSVANSPEKPRGWKPMLRKCAISESVNETPFASRTNSRWRPGSLPTASLRADHNRQSRGTLRITCTRTNAGLSSITPQGIESRINSCRRSVRDVPNIPLSLFAFRRFGRNGVPENNRRRSEPYVRMQDGIELFGRPGRAVWHRGG